VPLQGATHRIHSRKRHRAPRDPPDARNDRIAEPSGHNGRVPLLL
jgi:hypothetical protein